MQRIKVGLIGLGNMGRNHLRVLSMLKDVDLTFIYDRDTQRMEQYAQQYNVRASRDLAADLQQIDAAVIVSPTVTHYDYIMQCAQHVKHIFIEKPLTGSLDTDEKIIALLKDKDLHIQVGFIERFNPTVVVAKGLLAHSSGVINIDFTRTNKISDRITDVDVVIDLMIHDIDLALYLNGPAQHVTAYGVVRNDMIAFARASIQHESGAFSNVTASRVTEKRMRHIGITANKMYVDCNLLSKEVLVTKQSIEQDYENFSIISREETIDVKPQEALLSELLAFVAFCRGVVDSSVPQAQAGCAAMQVAHQVCHLIQPDLREKMGCAAKTSETEQRAKGHESVERVFNKPDLLSRQSGHKQSD